MGAMYTYQPLAGPLTGASFEAQTAAFLADAASRAEWGNVEGRPDLEGWQTTVNSQLADLDARAAAVEQDTETALSGVSTNAGALAAVRDRTTAAERDITALTDRADAGERAAAALAEQVGADEQALDATRADLTALEARTTASEASLTEAHNEAAAAAQAAQAAKDRAENHAERHAAEGPDPLTPADIGAAPAARGVPVGLIALWNGTTLPTGWAECTGTEGTPDLSAYAGGTLHYIQFKG